MRVILNAEPFGYSEKAINIWRNKGLIYQESSWEDILNSNSFEKVNCLIIRLARFIDDYILEKFPDLESLISATTGHDHIDVEAINRRGIKLISLRGHNDFLNTIPSTAEHTWALLMALLRNLPNANEDVKKGHWQRDNFRGYQLQNKILGLVGFGRVGKKVAEFGKAFGMNVVFYDPNVLGGLPSLKSLMQQADILSFHVHLKEDTFEMLNASNLKFLKKGVFLINTSRGKIWDEEVVVNALKEGVIGGVAVDVLATELHNIQKSDLWKGQEIGYNIIITPHIAGATWDAMWACEEFIAYETVKKIE